MATTWKLFDPCRQDDHYDCAYYINGRTCSCSCHNPDDEDDSDY